MAGGGGSHSFGKKKETYYSQKLEPVRKADRLKPKEEEMRHSISDKRYATRNVQPSTTRKLLEDAFKKNKKK